MPDDKTAAAAAPAAGVGAPKTGAAASSAPGSDPAPAPAPTPRQVADTLLTAVQKLVNLEIETRVIAPLGDAEPKMTPEGKLDYEALPLANVVRTRINLLEGDITTWCPASLFTDDAVGAALRAHHDAQVQKAREIIELNIRTLVDAAKALRG